MRALAGVGLVTVLFGALAACSSTPTTGPQATDSTTTTSPLPPGDITAQDACRIIVTNRQQSGFFTDVEQVHLVLTTYAKGEPVKSERDISHGMLPDTLVWVVEVHAKGLQLEAQRGGGTAATR